MGMNGSFTGREPAAMMALSKVTVAVGAFHFQRVRPVNLPETVHDLDFTHLGHASQTAGQLVDDLLFPQTHLVDVMVCGAPKDDAVLSQRLGFFLTLATGSALDGMQPTFRQTPPRVE